MFSGIVQTMGKVQEFSQSNDGWTFVVGVGSFDISEVVVGASIAIDGTCLTVVKKEDTFITFDISKETYERTIVSEYKVGTQVNVECSLKMGDEIGGHVVSGHVDGIGECRSIEKNVYTFSVPDEFQKYMFHKGFIAINGISLTIDKKDHFIRVHTIPETLQRTNLQFLNVGDKVNIEIDRTTQAIVDTVSSFMKQHNL